jgi:hypothetical protein
MAGIAMLLLAGGSAVRITDRSISDSDFKVSPATAFANSTYQLGSDGVARFETANGADGSYSSEWLLGGNAADYEARFAILTGSADGSFGVWLPLTTTRSISVTANQTIFGSTSSNATVLVDIRTTSGLILSTAVITLSATATVDA